MTIRDNVNFLCMNCEQVREHEWELEWGFGTYRCMSCGDTVTEHEYTLVMATIKDYHEQYKGAKRAGLIPDKEDTYHG